MAVVTEPEAPKGEERIDPAVHLGYALAVLIPVVGLLVGVALIARGDEDGPWVVGLAVAANVLYAIAVVAGIAMNT